MIIKKANEALESILKVNIENNKLYEDYKKNCIELIEHFPEFAFFEKVNYIK